LLCKDEARVQLQELRQLLTELDSRREGEVRGFDASDAVPSEISDWIAAQGLGDSIVTVFWPYDGEAALMNTKDVIKNLDDLWYPSSDDLVVLSKSNHFLLDIDHEERVSLYFLWPKGGAERSVI
jgi:hypothetical protein